MRTEVPRCPLCDGTTLDGLHVVDDCTISRCRDCRFVFCSDYQAFESPELYHGYNDLHLPEKSVRVGRHNRRTFLREARGFAETDSLLDFGCGLGTFLSNFPHRENKLGYEVSPAQAEHARGLGLTVHHGTLDELVATGRRFRWITAFQVLEHLEDPVGTLQKLRALLTPDGRLFLTTPNIRGITSRITRSRWLVLSPPLHLLYFDPRTLRRMLERSDLRLLRLRTENVDPVNILMMRKIRPDNRDILWHRLQTVKYGAGVRTRVAFGIRNALNHLLRLTRIGDNLLAVAGPSCGSDTSRR